MGAQHREMEPEMSLSGGDSRALAAIERRLSASAPRLTAMLATFTRLTEGEQMPSREQLPSGRGWLVTALAMALIVTVTTLASLGSTRWASQAPRTIYGTVLHLPQSFAGLVITRPSLGPLGK